MFHTIAEFLFTWKYESESTLKVFRNLTDASLAQAVGPGGRTLGRLAWHITGTLAEMMGHAGLPVEGPTDAEPIPATAAEIVRCYESGAKKLADAVSSQWTDAMLTDKIPMYGDEWPRAGVLTALISHHTHHRGQMTVLMRQAGLKVPGVYGPAREEWAGMNLPPAE
jgi:uncharacterized damage-inducible protein DinB